MPVHPLLLVFIFCLTSASSRALESQTADISLVAQKEQWRHLLHYHHVGLFDSYKSQADDPKFFLAKNGATDPEAELTASIAAFRNDHEALGNDAAQCRYPARYAWIRQQMPELELPRVACPDFDKWFQRINGGGLTLIFPAAYMNSPSSMYGHTLIRINRKGGGSALLDYGVNYAANADPEDNELVFSFKGLFGGYPGVVTIMPYYEKVNEYSFLESRDVWEYELDVTQEEVDQFVRHTWEIRDTHFDYYFFTENCSYHLLALLDAASERFDFADEFYERVIPSDTVRVVVDSGLIKDTHYRPSTLSELNHQIASLSGEQLEQAKQLVLDARAPAEQIAHLSIAEQARLLDTAYQYARYLAVRKKKNDPNLGPRTIALLSARSKLDVEKAFDPIPRPAVRDDEGHATRRFESRYGHDGDNHYLQFGLRMAYHDLLDPIAGYLQGARLEMFHLQGRHTFGDEPGQQDRTRLQSVGLIDIASLSPRNALLTPLSWRVHTGWKRFEPFADELIAHLNVGFGLTWRAFDQTWYGLVDNELNLDNDIDKAHRLASGPMLGWLWQTPDWSVWLEGRGYYDWSGAEFKHRQVLLGFSQPITKQWQWRLEVQHDRLYEAKETQGSLGLMYYF
jgi:hypothetical protein